MTVTEGSASRYRYLPVPSPLPRFRCPDLHGNAGNAFPAEDLERCP